MPRNLDNFGADDMVIPELKLVQGVGGEDAKSGGATPGDLFITIFDLIFPGAEGVDVVIVDMQKTRTYWGRDEIGEGPPQCSSNNADTEQAQDGTDCKTCEHRCDTPWLLSAMDRRTKCLLSYNILAINLTGGQETPLIIRAGGISTKAVRELNTQLKMNKALKQAGLHRGVVHVTSEKKKTASGEAFALKFHLAGLVTDMDQAKSLLMQSTELLGIDMAELAPVEQKMLETTEKQTITAKDVGKVEAVLGDLGPNTVSPKAEVKPKPETKTEKKPETKKVTYEAF